MPNVLSITKTEDLLVLKDPLAHLQNAYRQAQARGVARLQPNATPKGIIGRLDPFRRERYAKARRRWSVPANQMLQPDVYESPLQEATHLMRELAISLEAAKDDKRLGVARRVIALLQEPNILGHKLRDNITAEHLNADAAIREWLGAKAAPVGAPPVERAKTEPTRSTDWFELSIAPAVSQADAAAVSRMLESGICDWFSPGFDSIELDRLSGGNALLAFGLALHNRHGWAASLGIPTQTMATSLRQLQAAYNPVAYHNSQHATDVTHGVHWMVTRLEGLQGVASSPEMLFAAVVAALIHDVGHDGRGNAYHIATWEEGGGSEFVLLYSDQSVLERHHCALGFRIMRDTGLFSELPVPTRKAVRERIIGMVLATDFSEHVKIMNTFKRTLERGALPRDGTARGSGSGEGALASQAARTRAEAESSGTMVFSAADSTMSDAERLTVASMIIKVADLSYPTKGFDYSLLWIDRCLEEFMEQGEREKERGLPVGYDRTTLQSWKAKSQLGFFTFMVKPLYEAVDLLAPLTAQLSALDTLIEHWKGQVTTPSRRPSLDPVAEKV